MITNIRTKLPPPNVMVMCFLVDGRCLLGVYHPETPLNVAHWNIPLSNGVDVVAWTLVI